MKSLIPKIGSVSHSYADYLTWQCGEMVDGPWKNLQKAATAPHPQESPDGIRNPFQQVFDFLNGKRCRVKLELKYQEYSRFSFNRTVLELKYDYDNTNTNTNVTLNRTKPLTGNMHVAVPFGISKKKLCKPAVYRVFA